MAEDPSNTQKAIALAAGALPGILARIYGPDANSNVPPELRQLLAQQTQRSAYQNPLFEAVTGQALAGLPDYAKAGHTLGPSMGTGVPQVSGGGGGGGLGGALAAGAAGAGLGAMSNLPMQKLIDALKKLFQGQGPSVQRNKPYPGGALTGGNQPPPGFEGWDDPWANWGRDPNQWDPNLNPDVTTDQFLDQWPESYGSGGTGGQSPDMFPGGSGNGFDPYGGDLW
jgi:hypothetical protein